MSLYSPNNNKPFAFLVALLLLLLLLMIPLRPSNWGKKNTTVQDLDTITSITDSTHVIDTIPNTVITVTTVLDSQTVIVPSTDTSEADTSIIVTPLEVIDTVVPPVTVSPIVSPIPTDTAEVPLVITEEKADSDGWGWILGSLFLILLLITGVALAIYKIITARWKKKYWLQYSIKIKPLSVATSNVGDFNLDFNELKEETPKVIPVTDDKAEPVTDDKAEPVTDDKAEEEIPIEEEEIEKENKVIDPELVGAVVNTSQETQGQTTLSTPVYNANFLREALIPFFIEVTTRPFRIVLGVIQGILSIVSYFSSDTPQKKAPIDFKWHDGVSIVMVTFFFIIHAVIFPQQPSSTATYILMLILVWMTPSLIRQHWGFAVLGIILSIGEFSGLIIYIILEATKDAEPSDSNAIYYILGAIPAVAIMFWLFNKIKDKLTIDNLFKLIHLSVAIGFIYLFYNEGEPSQIISFLFFYYITYEAIEFIKNIVTKKKVIEDTPEQKPKPVLVKTPKKKKDGFLSDEEAKALFRKKEWWKKADLERMKIISMPNYHLNEQSEFIEFYLPKCVNARQLYLSNNDFTEIPFELTELEHLEVINLSYNNISEISPDIEYLSELQTLYLVNNNISDIPDEFGNLKNLQMVNLTGNPLTRQAIRKLHDFFPKAYLLYDKPGKKVKTKTKENPALVKKIRKLLKKELERPRIVTSITQKLVGQSLTDLPVSIFRLFPNLKELNINNNNFSEFPSAILEMTQLETLDLGYNSIEHIPNEISNLRNLKTIRIYGSKIKHFAPIPSLETLLLNDSKLTKIPDFIFKFTNLKKLGLVRNNIKILPHELTQLTKLEVLNLGHNEGLDNSAALLALIPSLKEVNLNGLCWANDNVPIDFDGFSTLTEIRLSYNKFSAIPEGIYELKKLKNLSFVGNELTEISPKIGNLTNMFYLDLEKNHISTLPEEIKKLKNLYVLSLNANPISKKELKKLKEWLPNTEIRTNNKYVAPDPQKKETKKPEIKINPNEDKKAVAKIKKLLKEKLETRENVTYISELMSQELDDLPLSILQLFPKLNSIYLHSNNFKQIPEAVYHIPLLEELSLSYNKITSIPDRISELKGLKVLDFSSNKIESISPKISELKNLEKLSLSATGLNQFPDFLFNMTQLKSLDLGSNRLSEIPKKITKLINLKELILDFTSIETIPASIFELTNLEHLKWTGNKLKVLPKELSKLKKLKKLDIGFNDNVSIPPNLLANFPHLRDLSMGGMGLTENNTLVDFSLLTNLESLWVSHNKFTKIPSSIFTLKKLRFLGLPSNNINEVSENIGELTNVEYLHLDKNELTTLPASFKKLTKLRSLYLGGNKFSIKEKKRIQRMLPNANIIY